MHHPRGEGGGRRRPLPIRSRSTQIRIRRRSRRSRRSRSSFFWGGEGLLLQAKQRSLPPPQKTRTCLAQAPTVQLLRRPLPFPGRPKGATPAPPPLQPPPVLPVGTPPGTDSNPISLSVTLPPLPFSVSPGTTSPVCTTPPDVVSCHGISCSGHFPVQLGGDRMPPLKDSKVKPANWRWRANAQSQICTTPGSLSL
jgi:hypothetical protein